MSGERVVKTIATANPTRRVVIVQRDDGRFSFAAESFRGKVYRPKPKGSQQRVWSRGQLDPSIYETVKIAERAARIRFPDLLT
jgi:hypothetical protein